MNPVERAETNPVNVHAQRAEAEKMLSEWHVHPTTPVKAAEVAGAIGANLAPVQMRHRARTPRPSRRRVIAFWVALIVAEASLMVWIWAQIGGAL